MRQWTLFAAFAIAGFLAPWCAPLAGAAPVALVLSSGEGVVLTQAQAASGQQALKPLQTLVFGDQIQVPRGQAVSLAVLPQGQRRLYSGPARLQVIADAVAVASGPRVRVFPLPPTTQELINQWLTVWAAPGPLPPLLAPRPKPQADALSALQPVEGAVLLTRSPVFELIGPIPREARLMVFDAQGRRVWVQPVEANRVELPAAANFEWGGQYTWEVRRLTGGRALSGSFSIASELTARALFEARPPAGQANHIEAVLLYGMRLWLAGAYPQAWEAFGQLGLSP